MLHVLLPGSSSNSRLPTSLPSEASWGVSLRNVDLFLGVDNVKLKPNRSIFNKEENLKNKK